MTAPAHDGRGEQRRTPLAQATTWLDEHYAAGAKKLGATCNPIQRKLFLFADDETLVIDTGVSQRETLIINDILHDHIGRYATFKRKSS